MTIARLRKPYRDLLRAVASRQAPAARRCYFFLIAGMGIDLALAMAQQAQAADL